MVRGITFLNIISRKIRDSVKVDNGNQKISFGLTSLLQTPTNKFQEKYFRNKSKVVSSTVIREKALDPGIRSTITGFLYRNKHNPINKRTASQQEGSENLVSSTYNSVKSPIVNLFLKQQTSKQTVTQIDKSNKSYISSAFSVLRTVKDGTGKVLYYSYDCIKSPVVRLISVNKPPPDEVRKKNKLSPEKVIKQIVFRTITKYSFSTFKRKNDENSQQELEFTEFEDNSTGNWWSLKPAFDYLSNALERIKIIIQNFNETSSNEEKCSLLLGWLNEINNIYYTMQTMNANNIILAQYSKYSKNMSNWIMELSENEDFKSVVTILSCATVISFQLFLIVSLGIPISDQLLNLAFSIYTNYNLLKSDPKIQQTLQHIMKQIQEYIFVDLSKLQSVDWKYYYYRVLEMANSKSITQ